MKQNVALVFLLLLVCQLHIIIGQKSSNGTPKSTETVSGLTTLTKILSVDGAAARGIIAVMTLIELENAIKYYILSSRPDLLPEDATEDSSPDDFDIFLADYMDIITGSAGGTWIQLYIATKGSDGSLRQALREPEIIDRYGRHTPGTAGALIVFFNEYVPMIYPNQPIPQEGPPQPPPQSGPGITETTHPREGTLVSMDALLGNNSLIDQQMTSLTPVADLDTGAILSMVTDLLGSERRIGFTNYPLSNSLKPENDILTPCTNFTSGVDFLLKDIAAVAAAGPTIIPSANITSISGPKTRVLGSDGFFGVSGNPTLLALSYAANLTGTLKLEDYAIFSVAGGVAVGNYEDNKNSGLLEWFLRTEFFQVALFLAGTDFAHQLDFLFARNPKVEPNQYLRIQTFGDIGTERGDLLAAFDRTGNLPELQAVGVELASKYSEQIHAFVREFIFD